MKRLWLVLLLPLLLAALGWWLVKYLWAIIFAPDHAWQLAVSVDQTANAAFNGQMDETISSRAGRHCRDSHPEDREAWACWLCKLLDKVDPDHCQKSIGV
jgi:hypothetical protein